MRMTAHVNRYFFACWLPDDEQRAGLKRNRPALSLWCFPYPFLSVSVWLVLVHLKASTNGHRRHMAILAFQPQAFYPSGRLCPDIRWPDRRVSSTPVLNHLL